MAVYPTVSAFMESALSHRLGVLKKYAAFDVFGRLIRRTPVDTGRAQNSWMIQVGVANLNVHPPVKKGTKLPPPPVPEIGRIPPGAEVHVSNNLPYIRPLNEGHSQQAPAGFVELAVAETQRGIGKLAAQIRRESE